MASAGSSQPTPSQKRALRTTSIVALAVVLAIVVGIVAFLLSHCHKRLRRARKRPLGTTFTTFIYPDSLSKDELSSMSQNQSETQYQNHSQTPTPPSSRPTSLTNDSTTTLQPFLPHPCEQQSHSEPYPSDDIWLSTYTSSPHTTPSLAYTYDPSSAPPVAIGETRALAIPPPALSAY